MDDLAKEILLKLEKLDLMIDRNQFFIREVKQEIIK